MKTSEQIADYFFHPQRERSRDLLAEIIRQTREEMREECAKEIQARADAYKGVSEVTVHECEQMIAAIRAIEIT